MSVGTLLGFIRSRNESSVLNIVAGLTSTETVSRSVI
jgi:hypothetical protein